MNKEKFMKRKLFPLVSLALALLCLLSACVKAPQTESQGDTENTTTVQKDVLLLNGINISEYTVIYDGRLNIGTADAQKYFASVMKQKYEIELEAKTSGSGEYRIFIGGIIKNSEIKAFFSTCNGGMLGVDGKDVYILAEDNAGYYSVIDAFFAGAITKDGYDEITVAQNKKVDVTRDSLRVMTFNVLNDLYYDADKTLPRSFSDMAEFIKSQGVDVFGTQETNDTHKSELLKAMPNFECYAGVKLKGSSTMNAIFWNADKYKAVAKGFQYLTDTPYVESKIPESNSYRGFSYVILESLTTHKQFMFVNVHLTYRNAAGETNADDARYKQMQYLNKFLESNKCDGLPVILVGDFNSIPGSNTLTSVENLIRFDRTATVAKETGDVGGTLTKSLCTERDKDTYVFDHIFVTSDSISTEYYSVIDGESKQNGRYLSDHLPVISDIVIY